MTHPPRVVAEALSLVAEGLNDCEISRRLGVNRRTVCDWRNHGPPAQRGQSSCPICTGRDLDPCSYAYLLGLYLGDGCLTAMPRDVYKLRIVLDAKYPLIIGECKDAIRAVRSETDARIGTAPKVGCFEIYHHWKHWICLFPQHGPGRKHKRSIELETWQESVLIAHPERLLRGLIHSDGCRVVNRVNGGEYPRYQFSNRSEDIRKIFCRACDAFDVAWRQSNAWTISVSRRPAVERLDRAVGPKT